MTTTWQRNVKATLYQKNYESSSLQSKMEIALHNMNLVSVKAMSGCVGLLRRWLKMKANGHLQAQNYPLDRQQTWGCRLCPGERMDGF